MEPPKDKEEALAGLLNGTMVTLLGGAFPALFLWQVGRHWQEILGGHFLDGGVDNAQDIGALTLSVYSFFIIRSGIRMLHLNSTSLRKL